jgi:hypothetical protein
MVGRHRDPNGIDYPFKSIEKDPKEINFDSLLGKGENIYVLAHQPGIGKTYNVMKYIEQKIQDDNEHTGKEYFQKQIIPIDSHGLFNSCLIEVV